MIFLKINNKYDKIMGDCNDSEQLTNLLEECKKQTEMAKTNQALVIKLQKDLDDSQVKCDNEKWGLEQVLKYDFQLEREHLNHEISY